MSSEPHRRFEADMSAEDYAGYLDLLSASFKRDRCIETWETRYLYIEQQWQRKRWRVLVVDRRTGEIRTRYAKEYQDVRAIAAKWSR